MTVSMRSRLLAASSTVTTSGMAASAAVTSARSLISQSTSTSARHICFGSPIRWAVLQAAPEALSRSQRAARVVAWTPRTPAASDQLIRGAICRALISCRSSSLISTGTSSVQCMIPVSIHHTFAFFQPFLRV